MDVLMVSSIGLGAVDDDMASGFDEFVVQRVLKNRKLAESCLEDVAERLQSQGRNIFLASEDGILHNFWQYAEEEDSGICIHFENVPIMQEVVEILESRDLNPYEISARGIGFAAVTNGMQFVDEFLRDYPQYSGLIGVIGYLTKGTERVMLQRGEKRYLVPPGRSWC
ncbi:MAG: hypothetical protein K6G63_09740 [Eubacterium sp.]|nr:hypothetical protein [Eubacterium sp.]